MSRIEEYEPDDIEDELRCWSFQNNTERHLKGKKGQAMLRELEAALLALPEKRLEYSRFVVRHGEEGGVCALGALALKRKMDQGLSRADAMKKLSEDAEKNELDMDEEYDSAEWSRIERTADYLQCKVNFAFAVIVENDEWGPTNDAEERYRRLLEWCRRKIEK